MGSLYTICVTHYNNKSTIEKSLKSILAQIDTDFEIVVVDNMSTDGYHQKCEGNLLWGRSINSRGFWGEESFMVAPRILLTQIGGWKDLQFGEDWELARRASFSGAYRWTYFKLLEDTNSHPERKTLIGRMKYRYVKYRDLMRCGSSVFKEGDHISITQRVPLFVAKLSLPFYESYGGRNEQTFEPYLVVHFVDFGEIHTNG